MYNTLRLFSNENGKRESSHQKRRKFAVKRYGKLRYPVKFPCSLLEVCREQGPQVSYVIQQHEG